MRNPEESPGDIVSCLKALGLTKYEALVYIALLKVLSATASEIHEISGVPRASVYPVLDQLLDKSLVSVSQSAPKRFAAVPPESGITLLLGRIERDAQSARSALDSIYHERMSSAHVNEELIWNVYGIENIRMRLLDLLAGAKENVRITAHPRILSDDLRKVLIKTAERVPVDIVTPEWQGKVPPNMKIYLKKALDLPKNLAEAKDMLSGGVCIIDNKNVMVILGTGDVDAVALYSEAEGFVKFFTRYYSMIFDWARKPDQP
jgi:HTH-type transcriptional regulator, sugar sensing transcriptional regulator